ncbi:unnamed protein product [Victoria cruziana]
MIAGRGRSSYVLAFFRRFSDAHLDFVFKEIEGIQSSKPDEPPISQPAGPRPSYSPKKMSSMVGVGGAHGDVNAEELLCRRQQRLALGDLLKCPEGCQQDQNRFPQLRPRSFRYYEVEAAIGLPSVLLSYKSAENIFLRHHAHVFQFYVVSAVHHLAMRTCDSLSLTYHNSVSF